MKQHITIEQLNELSDKGRKKLREWWKPEEGDWISFKDEYGDTQEVCIAFAGFKTDWDHWGLFERREWIDLMVMPEIKMSDMLNVEGNLITADYATYRKLRVKGTKLMGTLPLLSIGKMIELLEENAVENWNIRLHSGLVDLDYPVFRYGPDDYEDMELCDALWEAVKQVLEDDNGKI